MFLITESRFSALKVPFWVLQHCKNNESSFSKCREKISTGGLEQDIFMRSPCKSISKQDGNVPSRRHILGSKIFKEQLLEKFGKFFFSKKNFDFFSKKSIF